MSKRPRDPDERVGYRRPPCSSRFKRGKSGNPAGRRRGERNTRTLIEIEGAQEITFTEGGVKKTMTKREAAVKALFAKAMKGDVQAFKVLAEFMGVESATAAPEAAPALSDADLAAMRRHADWLRLIDEAEKERADDEGG